MKRGIFFAAMLILFLIPLISASQIDLNKQTFNQGETLFAKISGNFVDQITQDSVHFYRGHVEIGLDSDIERIGEDYFIYSLLQGRSEGNYSLRIENVRHYKATSVIDDDISENFTISNTTADFSINPGFVSLLDSDKSFSVGLKNLVDERINIEINSNSRILPEEGTFDINVGAEKTINFDLNNPEEKEEIVFSSGNTEYTLTIFIDGGSPVTGDLEEKDIDFGVGSLDISMSTDSNTKRIVYLKNTGKSNLKDVEIGVSEGLRDYVSLSPSTINNLDVNESEKIELLINSGSEEKTISGDIIAYSDTENVSTSSRVVLDFLPRFVSNNTGEEVGNENEQGNKNKLCAELGAEICSDTQVCEGDISQAKDGTCCFGTCSEESSGFGGTSKWVGWVLLVLIILIVFWFFKSKYKKAGKSKNGLSKFLKKK